MSLSFLPIDLEHTKDLCIRFREDAFKESFGSIKAFHEADNLGSQRYIKWLKQHLKKPGSACAHVWLQGQIIGQIELTTQSLLHKKKKDKIGYINLYYLTPEYRGKGHSSALDDFSKHFFLSQNITQLYLSVSPRNERALAFYKKQGWLPDISKEQKSNLLMLTQQI